MDELAQQIAAGGTFGLIIALLVGLWALATGFVRVGKLVDKNEEKLVTDRDQWRTMAETSIAKLGRLTDVLEATVGKKLE